MEDPRIRKLARYVVTTALAVQPGDRVLVELRGREVDVARVFVEEVHAAGGLPIARVEDPTIRAAIYGQSSNEHIAWLGEDLHRTWEQIDCFVFIDAASNPYSWDAVPTDRKAAYRTSVYQPVYLDLVANSRRWCVLRWPNDAMAMQAGMPTAAYEDFYFDACLVDYPAMTKALEALKTRMDHADQVHILGPGTDLTFSVKGIDIMIENGLRNIPDGEAATAPVRDSVNGVITYNVPSTYDGFVYRDVRFVFENGRIVEATGNDPERINRLLDTDEGARYIGEFAFGVNPAITQPIGDILFDEKIIGSFHLTPGNCYENADNGNHSGVHWDLVCSQRPEHGGGEIWIDGELLRKDGLFVPEDLWPLNAAEDCAKK